MQPNFFDFKNRHHKLNERDPLTELNRLVDWGDSRTILSKVRTKKRKSSAGRKPFDALLMFKTLILQRLYNLPDDEPEFQIQDHYSFCRFPGINSEGKTRDAKIIWLFR
ncbi:transposase [uncultured Microbulbifer sp.]|uniref:transposase n=1 Tax=uncultured Microbulbifer sp. TaxID=348147 RepID=UPI00344F3E01